MVRAQSMPSPDTDENDDQDSDDHHNGYHADNDVDIRS